MKRVGVVVSRFKDAKPETEPKKSDMTTAKKQLNSKGHLHGEESSVAEERG